MPDLLLELFSEEIPARMQPRAREDLKRLVTDGLVAAGLSYEGAKAFSTPRRLALAVEGVPATSPDVREERKGPRVGAPEKAVQGFLRAAGLSSLDQCETRDDGKGAYYVARIEKPGRPAGDIIAEVVEAAVRSFPWPKSMRWGAGELRWVRPLHSIVATFGAKTETPEIVPVRLDGVAAGNTTRGHRVMAPGEITVSRLEDYAGKLEAARVEIDAERREGAILADAKALALAQGLEVVDDPALAREVAGLVEWPVTLMGGFDEAFLALPPEVLATTMRVNQKYFALRDSKTGKLANRFIMVANIEAEDGGKAIVAGNERVLAARLHDAKFFWEQDLRTPLEKHGQKLGEVVFHDRLGTQAERVERIARLARELAPVTGADPDKAARASRLAKADLVTGMVGEFPELQGLMGRYYALEQGETPEVADAIRDHYKPQGPSDEVPKSPVSVAVALADKLDMLVGFWAIDEKPTGSRDPYALRRAALGVIRMVLENRLRIGMRRVVECHVLDWLTMVDTNQLSRVLINYENQETNQDLQRLAQAAASASIAADLLAPSRERYDEIMDLDPLGFDPDPVQDSWIKTVDGFTEWQGRVEALRMGERDNENLPVINELGSGFAAWSAGIRDNLLSFFADRLKVHLREQGARHDLIDAVFSLGGQDDLLMIVRRVGALGDFLGTDDGANLLIGVKRAINILRDEEKKDGEGAFDGEPDQKLFDQDEEKRLYEAIGAASGEVAAAVDAEEFSGAMTAIAGLRGPIDAFFDHVTVNAGDAKLRANRLKLLNLVRRATFTIADFSRIAGE